MVAADVERHCRDCYNVAMFGFLTILVSLCEVIFPTFMLCLTYPFSKKAALFWSDYITCRSARVVFGIMKLYRNFSFLGENDSLAILPEQYVVVSNHQSLFDIAALFRFLGGKRTRFVAKDTLVKVPMVGKMLKAQRHCMVPRKGSPTVSMGALDKFSSQVVRENQIPVIFPEGTRSRDGSVGKFYSAGFRRLAEKTGLPIAVFALDGGWKIAKLGTILTNLHRGVYRVKALKVFSPPQTKEDEKRILEEARDLIVCQLDEWRALP